MSVEQALDKLSKTANRIADERNEFKAQRDELLEALNGLLWLWDTDRIGHGSKSDIVKTAHGLKAARLAVELVEASR